MKIMVHDYAGHAFQVQLSRALAHRRHEVLHLYAGYNQTPRGSLKQQEEDPTSFDARGVFIKNPLDKDHFIRRWFQENEYGRLLAQEEKNFSPDVIISANTPLDAQSRLFAKAERQSVGVVFWLQDFIGIATHEILKQKLPRLGNLVGKYYLRLEKNLLQRSDAIVAISEDFVPTLNEWGVEESKVEVIPNWAPLGELPVMVKGNHWALENNMETSFNFIYSGTLRMKHNPRLLLELARSLSGGDPYAKVVVTSEGPGAAWLEARAHDQNLKNLVVLPFQPMVRYPEVLASGDVLVAILEKEAGAFSVPSKVLSYLCAQRPLLLAVPGENLAAKIVDQYRAGIVAEPDDLDGFIQGAQILMASPNLRQEMAKNARQYAETHFDIEAIADRFEGIIQRL